MRAADLHLRVQRLAPELHAGRHRIDVRASGDLVDLCLSERYLFRKRRLMRGGGVVILAVGILTAPLHPWLIVLAAVGAVVAVLGPRWVGTAPLLRLDAAKDELVVMQRAAQTGTAITADSIRRIDGRHEVFGWEPRSALYAVSDGGTVGPILVFGGTDDALAAFACRVVGLLLDVPATYRGAFGVETECHRPERVAEPSAR